MARSTETAVFPKAKKVDLTDQQRSELAEHFAGVPSQGALFAQVWPTHVRVSVFTAEEADRMQRLLKAIYDMRKASA